MPQVSSTAQVYARVSVVPRSVCLATGGFVEYDACCDTATVDRLAAGTVAEPPPGSMPTVGPPPAAGEAGRAGERPGGPRLPQGVASARRRGEGGAGGRREQQLPPGAPIP